jgi:hypothetical protein
MRVNTFLPFFTVLIIKPSGIFTLSGETALAMAPAYLTFLYESEISASKFQRSQLFSNKLVHHLYEKVKQSDWHLRTSRYIVPPTFSRVFFR